MVDEYMVQNALVLLRAVPTSKTPIKKAEYLQAIQDLDDKIAELGKELAESKKNGVQFI